LPSLVVVEHGGGLRLLNERSVSDHGTNNIRVNVRGGSSVLDIALTIVSGDKRGDTEGGSSVSSAVGEGLARRCLVDASQSLVIVVTVDADVKLMFVTELLHHAFDVSHALRTVSHGVGRVVGMAAGTVPVSEEFGRIRDAHVVVLGDTAHQVAGDPHVITDINANAGTDLVFELAGHDLDVGPGDGDASVKAGFVVGIGDGASESSIGTN